MPRLRCFNRQETLTPGMLAMAAATLKALGWGPPEGGTAGPAQDTPLLPPAPVGRSEDVVPDAGMQAATPAAGTAMSAASASANTVQRLALSPGPGGMYQSKPKGSSGRAPFSPGPPGVFGQAPTQDSPSLGPQQQTHRSVSTPSAGLETRTTPTATTRRVSTVTD